MNENTIRDFETAQRNALLRLCTEYGYANGVLLQSEDIDRKWDEMAAEYVADAVSQIAEYPLVALAWAAYLGMAVANAWDDDWEKGSKAGYKSYYGRRGFDDMDDHIVRDLLKMPLGSKAAQDLTEMVFRMAELCNRNLRANFAAQTNEAFQGFARSCKALFLMGASMELKRLGYKFERVR